MLWQRLLFGMLMIAGICGLVVLDGWLSGHALAAPDGALGCAQARQSLWCGLPITLLVVVLVVLAVYELGDLCRCRGHKPATHWAAFVAALLAITPWIEMQRELNGSGLLTCSLPANLPLPVFLLVGGFLGACLTVLTRKTTQGAIGAMGSTVFLMLYLGLLASFVVRIRGLSPGAAGSALVIFFILTVKAGDIGAYFTGKLLGKHKLAPWLSPGKTVEGAVGALVLATGVAIGGMAAWSGVSGTLGAEPLTFAQAIVFGVVMAAFGHLGDLVESAIKRDSGSKDSGRLVPAFGGFLDIVDSPVFAAPIAWWLLTFFGSIG